MKEVVRFSSVYEVVVEFYPYVGINNRIRRRDGVILVRISDLLKEAPESFHEALAEILIRKLHRKRVPKEVSNAYNSYINLPEVRERSQASRAKRGRKNITSSKGSAYDLDEMFDFLNQIYFRNALSKPALTWSLKKTYRILGHHDPTHDAIVISRSLDDIFIPRYVVEFVMYHEMLHIAHPTKIVNGRRYNHTAAFRKDEEQFAFFREAEDWIERNTGSLRRAAKKKR